MAQLAKLASTAHTAKSVGGKRIRTHVARVGATPWKPLRKKRGNFYHGTGSGVGRPSVG